MKPSNILKIDTLSENWYDKDGVILHACFQILTDFIEQESDLIPEIGNESHVDWDADEKHQWAKQEMLALYY
ncbi:MULTISPECIES: hypothetical protein [unclassified Acinetobacter]|uniref:hypothetical protein n=1 Tax=unclassified Acinetobacter TaxID=196816 RepID=UPI0035B6B21F